MPAKHQASVAAKLAEEWRISKSSAVEVYERLVGLELIEVRGHHGFFVKLRRSDTDSDGKRGNLQIPTTPAARGRYPTTGFHPSGSWLGSHVLPLDALRFALRETARAKTPELLSYGDPRGYMPLRMLLAERLVALGIKAQSDSILITDSASMAIDMICRLLLSPGDTVLVDDPTSLDFASLSNLHSVKVVGVPFNGQCRDLDALRRIIATHNPKLYLLSPFLHNPTGTTMPPSQVFEILSILRTAGVYVIEDDVYADLHERPAMRLSALSGQGGVAYVSSFSKTISPSLRCGFISCEAEIAERLFAQAMVSNFGLNTLTSIVTYKLLESGSYRRNLQSMRKSVAEEREDAIAQLKKLGFEVPVKPESGVFIWARWPGPATAQLISDIAIKRDIVLAPGETFSPTGQYHKYIRFNCTLMKTPGLFPRMADVLIQANAVRASHLVTAE